MSDERWVPIPGYEGYYEISSHRRVRAVERTVPVAGRGQRKLRARFMNPSNHTTEPRLILSRDHDPQIWILEDLYRLAFHEESPLHPQEGK